MVLMVNMQSMIIGQRMDICGENDFLVVASVAEVRMEGRLLMVLIIGQRIDVIIG